MPTIQTLSCVPSMDGGISMLFGTDPLWNWVLSVHLDQKQAVSAHGGMSFGWTDICSRRLSFGWANIRISAGTSIMHSFFELPNFEPSFWSSVWFEICRVDAKSGRSFYLANLFAVEGQRPCGIRMQSARPTGGEACIHIEPRLLRNDWEESERKK